ncbi:MAG: aminotransferase [Paracoccaceae bacterium]
MADDRLTNAQVRDLEALLHPNSDLVRLRERGAHSIASGSGVHVTDESGRRYIEAMSGLWCCGLGFDEPELVEAAAEQMARLPYYHLFGGRTHEPAIELAEAIKDLFPEPMARVFYASSGSEANDTQIKAIWYYNNARGLPRKKKIVSRRKGYHGVTLATASLTGIALNHDGFDLPLGFARHTTTPHFWREGRDGEDEAAFCARLAADLDALIEAEGPETVAAFIAEPVMGAGGVIVPPEGYFAAIQPVLERHDVVLIDDEVICGFGRTGTWFGAETMGMRPDTVSMAKQLTSAYVPLSAVALRREIAEAVEAEAARRPAFGHGFTYGGHPVGCAVALKAIEIYRRRDIPGHVARIAPAFQQGLRAHAEHPLVGEARGVGLLGALELSPDREARATFAEPGKVGPRFAEEMLERGVLVRALGDTVAFCPPMVIDEAGVEEMLAPLGAALDATLDWARAEGRMTPA